MSAPILVLTSTNRNFPLNLERELKDRSFHRLNGLDEFISSPLRTQPFLLILEVGATEDIERALIAFEWGETVQPLAAGRFLLIVAKNISLGDRAARFRGAEMAFIPLNARNLAFKLDLQLKLLAAAPAPSPAAREASSGFIGEMAALPGRPERVMVLRGPGPKRGGWRPAENAQGARVRWRWVESGAQAKAAEELQMRWEAESKNPPVYEEKQKAWVIDDPAADVKCLTKDKEIYSARKEIAREVERLAIPVAERPRAEAAVAAPLAPELREAEAPIVAPTSSATPRAGALDQNVYTSSAAPRASEGSATLQIERAAPAQGPGSSQVFAREQKPVSAEPVDPKSLGTTDTGQVSSAAARNTERKESDQEQYQVSRAPEATRELGDLRGASTPPPAAEESAKEAAVEKEAEETKTLAGLNQKPAEAYAPATPSASTAEPSSSSPVSSFAGSRISAEPARDGSMANLSPPSPAAAPQDGKILYGHEPAKETPRPKAPVSAPAADPPAKEARMAPTVEAPPPARVEKAMIKAEAEVARPRSEASAPAASELVSPRRDAPATPERAELVAKQQAAPQPELVATQTRRDPDSGPATQSVRSDPRAGERSVTFKSDGPRDTGAGDVTRFRAGPQGENEVRISQDVKATGEATMEASGRVPPAEEEASLKQRLSFVLTCAELGDQNSAWHPAGGHRIYLSAHHRYRGYRSLSELLPLWVYEGELPPEFLEGALAWRFFDRMPQRFDTLAALPPGLTAELLRPGGLADGDPAAPQDARDLRATTVISSPDQAVGVGMAKVKADRPAGPWWRSVWSIFRGFLGR